MRDLGVNDLKDFVCLTSQVKCNSKCDDCSECENKIDKWLAEHDEQIRADERAKTIKDLYASDKSSTLNELLDMARADERRKFAEWLKNRHRYLELISTDELDFDLAEYEKEQAK